MMIDFLIASYAASVVIAAITVMAVKIDFIGIATSMTSNRSLAAWYSMLIVWVYVYMPIYNTIVAIAGMKKLFDIRNTRFS